MNIKAAKPNTGAVGASAPFAIAGVLALWTANECHNNFDLHHVTISFLPSLLFGLVTWMWWAVFAVALWWLATERLRPVLRLSPGVVCCHLGLACLLAVTHVALLQHTLWWAGAEWPAWGHLYASLSLETVPRFGLDIALYGFIYGVSALFYSQRETQRALVQRLELERQLSQAQLKALQMQMEPHFLFNTLNAMTSLMAQGRHAEAMKTLTHLNTILRMTLQRRAPEKVPFTEELRVIESYLAIQQVRFADRLQVKIEATPEALEGLVPCFLLQPIVENAIQHGIAPMETGGVIEALVKRVGDKLWMQVRDNGCGATGALTKGHGIGVQNTRDRLALFYPEAHEFAAAPLASGGYAVTIEIPYERAVA